MIKIYRLRELAIMPKLGSEGAAGYDLFTDEPFTLWPMERRVVDTGIATEFSPDVQAVIRPRSGLAAKHGIDTLAGLIDSDFRGSVGVVLINLGDREVNFTAGQAIAQIVFMPVLHNVIEAAGSISETVRGAGGFGSTDAN